MDAQLNRTSLKWGVTGLTIQTAAMFIPALFGESMDAVTPLTALLFYGVAFFGAVLFMIGLGYYAAAKGHSRWAGLLGMFSIVGYIVLAMLPDRKKNGAG